MGAINQSPAAQQGSANVTRSLPVIQTKGVPAGTAAFEETRQTIIDEFNARVPDHLRIDGKYTTQPPLNVTDIPRSCEILSQEELAITEDYDAVGLAAAIAQRKYTAVAVATAFLKRAIICHQITHCLTQWFPEEAMKQAQALDDYLTSHGKTVGPLHGVPISLKEHIALDGKQTSYGFVASIHISEEDSQMVSILRSLGAVFYVKTMQPQGLLHMESDNHLGRVLNPFNIHLSAGGSSGGEAALIALRGSVLGVGTDLGGSVRAPAAFCGIYGFKPTAYTLPMQGFLPRGFSAGLNIQPCAGPMCRSLRDMDLFMRVILAQKPHLEDPLLVPIPWTGPNTEVRKLKIGIMATDGMITPTPPILRAIAWAQKRLGSCADVEIKSFAPYQAREALSLVRRIFMPDGGVGFKKILAASGEPEHLLTSAVIDVASDSSHVSDVALLRSERDEYRRTMAKHWNKQDVDIVLMPVFVGPAPAHDTAIYKSYTSVWNLVDYPAVSIPTPLYAEAKGLEVYADSHVLGKEDAFVRRAWEETSFEGAPLSLQLVARKHHDSLLFGALQLLKEPLQLD
ncbi:fatty-acid amide hydrolase [Aureobasidium subglaciale]|nr:fatty-acid amide hydrolase [Aureobasidium subglaciale]